MEVKSSYLDEYRIIRTLGSGYHAKVKLAEGPDHKLVAIKRFKHETATIATLKHELSIMAKLNHENLVNLIDVRDNSNYTKKNGTTFKCFAIILEYAGGGQLFDFVALGGRFSPNVARTYFYQMMSGLNYMHSKGYAHRDIKPENLLLTSDFVLKIADFGFATLLEGKDKSGILKTKLGTDGYMAPEIQKKNYVGTQVDIFAAGVILFIMYTASPPFEKSIPEDPYYRLIKDKNYAAFWNFHSKRKPAGFFTDDFKDLIQKMLAFDPSERPTMVQIASHPWVTGTVYSLEQMRQEFVLRKKKVDEQIERQRKEKELKKAQKNQAIFSNKLQRHDDEQIQAFKQNYEAQQGGSLPLLRTKNIPRADDFVIDETEEFFFANIMALFNRNKRVSIHDQDGPIDFEVEAQIKEDKIEATFTYDYDSNPERVSMTIHVSKTPDKKLCLSFIRNSGQPIYFKRLVVLIKGEFRNSQVTI